MPGWTIRRVPDLVPGRGSPSISMRVNLRRTLKSGQGRTLLRLAFGGMYAWLAYRIFVSTGAIAAVLFVAALPVFWLADVAPNQLIAWVAERWPLLLFLSALVPFIFLEHLTDTTGSLAFYETAAQVIPVLLLVMALEVRLVPPRTSGVDLRTAMLVVYVLLGGEFAALQSVARGHGGQDQMTFTVAALTCGFVAVALIGLGALPRRER